ncbi:MAG: leucine-rich repeat protein [Lachnospiraceae bacterium]|nr:leucine-rich repeat protein [Lachnospiraceae bacterium]
MFSCCTSLLNAPELPAATLTEYCYYDMFYGCTSLMISDTRDDFYNAEYRIPKTGTGTAAGSSLTNMFKDTGGDFTGTPEINKTYYLHGCSITLTGGGNAAVSGGSTTQYIYAGEMTPVTYTADRGFYFEEFEDIVSNGITVKRTDEGSVTVSGTPTGNAIITVPDAKGLPYLTFAGTGPFMLLTTNYGKGWDGILEYSTDAENWYEWVPAADHNISSVDNVIYLRGKDNTVICDYSSYFSITPEDTSTFSMACCGDIRTLLDYSAPEKTIMGKSCFSNLFFNCRYLIEAPSLPSTTLSSWCYSSMFGGCTSLEKAPSLPATELAGYCYESMFYNCTSLKEAPALPATDLADNCYYRMFGSCKSLTVAPSLPATELAEKCYYKMFAECESLGEAPVLSANVMVNGCYGQMFKDCTSLIEAPELPATTLSSNCYDGMFNKCASLTVAPDLPAKELASFCYYEMFRDCTSLGRAPALSANVLANDCCHYMFGGCTSLEKAPALPATTLAYSCYQNMFNGCTSLSKVPVLPATTLAGYCYCNMFSGCTSLKISETKDDFYNVAYRIPETGNGTVEYGSLEGMFEGTGGEFTGTPEINKTYYVHGYSITLTGGGNSGVSGGSETQYIYAGEMTPVTYKAGRGFYFEEFEDIESNGITVKRTGDKSVTVSGTPTSDVSIKVPDARYGYTATIEEAPKANALTYDGSALKLVTSGKASGGMMRYALGADEATAPDASAYTGSIPSATDAGKYYVWYMAEGDDDHGDSEAAGPVTVNVKKAPHDDRSGTYETKYGESNTISLDGYIEEGGTCGGISISDEYSVLDGEPSVTGNDLSYSFAGDPGKLGRSAVVEIPVRNCVNYLDYKVVLTLTVSGCTHRHTGIRDAVQADCVTKGYSGDEYCTDCGSLVKKGTETPVDPDRHMHTGIRDAVQADCVTEGYSGDEYCTDCGKLVRKGETTGIDPDNHDPDEGVVTREPTHLSDGVKTHTCRRCGVGYTEAIPRLTDDDDSNTLIEDVKEMEGEVTVSENVIRKEDGSIETTVIIGGKAVSRIVEDARGNAVEVETEIWTGGLMGSYRYTGSAIKPVFHVYDGVKLLTEKTDYTVSFRNNKKAGSDADVTIKFKGSYKGTEVKHFHIDPAVIGEDVIVYDTSVAKTGKVIKPVLDVLWAKTGKKVSAKEFKFECGTEIRDAGVYMVKVTPEDGSLNFALAEGADPEGILVVTDKTNLLSKASVKMDPKRKYYYTGDGIVPEKGSYTLTLNGSALTEGTDYEVDRVVNNVDPGTAVMVFRAVRADYDAIAGVKTASFKILKGRDITNDDGFVAACSDSVPYAKGGAKPEVTVTFGSHKLKAGKDYAVKYSKNTAVTSGETAKITVSGKGNFKGKKVLRYSVVKQDLSVLSSNILVDDVTGSAKGYENPSVTVTDLDGKKLKAGTDFELRNFVKADGGNAVTAEVAGKGNYEGYVPVSYRIIEKDQQIGRLGANRIADKVYTGEKITLTEEDLRNLLYSGKKGSAAYLIPDTDFEVVSYSNNLKAGSAKVTLRGLGKYGGTRTLTFRITARTE